MVEGEVAHLLQHLPEAVTVAEGVLLLQRCQPMVMAVVEEVPLVEVAEEARRLSRAPRRWLRDWLLNLLLREAEEGAEPPLVAVLLLVEVTVHWLLLLLAVVLLLAARTTWRLRQHPRRRPNQCFLRIRALEVGKLLRREISLPPRHPRPSRPSLQPRMAPLRRRRSSPER